MNTANEVIRAKKCAQCGTINHLSKIRCLKCRGNHFDEITHPAQGVILTFTNCTALPERLGARKSQGFAMIQLRPGWNVLGQLDDPDNVSIGTRVTGKWAAVSQTRDGSLVNGWIFRKEEEKI